MNDDRVSGGEPHTILVADDDAVNRQLLRRLLVRKGYRVTEAADGGEALQCLRESPGLHAALLDVRMPPPDGLAVARAWRAEEADTHIPLIAVTANVSAEDRRSCTDAGMDGFLPKPVRARELYQTIDALSARLMPLPSSRQAGRPRWLRDAVERMDGDGEILAELIADFTVHAPLELEALERHCRARDEPAVRFSGHKLRGQLMNLGARDVVERIDELERRVADAAAAGVVEEAVAGVRRAVDGLLCRCREAEAHIAALATDDRERHGAEYGRVLVIEDERHTRRMIQRFLERQGYEVALADTGEAGLDIAREWPPDLVLLDCLLPGMDGFETLAGLRALDNEAATAPALMLTILNDETSAERALAAGAHDFITKPLFLPVLRQRIRHIIEAREKEQRVFELAYYDHLTGLLNRVSFDRTLEELVDQPVGGDGPHVLLYVDLDKFKLINDSCGHHAGDEFLRQIGGVLRSMLRQQDTVARLGGDEFGIVLRNCGIDVGRERAQEIVDRVSSYRFNWEGGVYEVGVSIGVVPVEPSTTSAERLLSTADAACYAAKAEGRNRVRELSPLDTLMEAQESESKMVPKLLRAIETDAFVLYRQRISPVGAFRATFERYEILLRMVEPDGRVLSAGEFVPVAERYQLMDRIDYWVVQRVCQRLAEEDDDAIHHVNLSALSLNRNDFAGEIRELMQAFDTDPARLCFEITETEVIRNLGRARETIRSLTELGCEFALDDFGAGLSSFGYLKELPVSLIKIDGGFIRDMATDDFDHAMVDAINHMAGAMGMKTVAEFVDSPAVLRRLDAMGVNYAQGFLLHRPEAWRVDVH